MMFYRAYIPKVICYKDDILVTGLNDGKNPL